MYQKLQLLLALSAGAVIGATVLPALNAGAAGRGAYVVTETHVSDPAAYVEYLKQEAASLGPFHGRVLARALPDVRSGRQPDGTVAIIAFDSPEDASRWYDSPDYQKLLPFRQIAAVTRLYILDGSP